MVLANANGNGDKRIGRKPYSDRSQVRQVLAARVLPKTEEFLLLVMSGMPTEEQSIGRAIDVAIDCLRHSALDPRAIWTLLTEQPGS